MTPTTTKPTASQIKAEAEKRAEETPLVDTSRPVEVTPPEPEPEPEPPVTVIQALAAVISELPAIGRDMTSEQGYAYRGIEDITKQASRLFGKYGVVWVPRVIDRDVKELVINNRPWTEDHLVVEYTVYGPSHRKLDCDLNPDHPVLIEDCIVVGPIHALGRDNSDKGVNKAMTQAYKYALLQTLCISDAKDDGDQQPAHEADEQAPPAPPPDPRVVARAAAAERIRGLTPAQRQDLGAFCENQDPSWGKVPIHWTDDQLVAVNDHIDALLIKAEQDAAVEHDATLIKAEQDAAAEQPSA